MKFAEIRYKNAASIIFPIASSERRKYIPIGFIEKDVIATNRVFIIYDAQPWLFGVLTSQMHMVWQMAFSNEAWNFLPIFCYTLL